MIYIINYKKFRFINSRNFWLIKLIAMIKEYFLYIFFFATIFFVHAQKVKISGNSLEIKANGSNEPKLEDETSFSQVDLGQSLTHTFTISNKEKKDNITIENISVSGEEFSISHKLIEIKKGESGTFDVTFQPNNGAIIDEIVAINLKSKHKRKTSKFNIRGNDINVNVGAEVMITQYFENGRNDDFVEIKNISGNATNTKDYYLVHYKRRDDLNKPPKKGSIIEIQALAPNEVIVYNKFKLDGNDIVILSTSKGKKCYVDRVDIIGSQNSRWGKNTSFTKGGCASENAHFSFDINDWVEVETSIVNGASNKQNIAIGTYTVGPISWDGSNWSENGLPDRSRIAIIDGNYNALNGDIRSCDLEVRSDLIFDNNTKNSVVIYRDLQITGSFVIGDEESLVMYDDAATIIGNITKKENSTPRANTYDFTYWTSPISDGNIGTVFSGVTPGRIYYYDQSQSSSSNSNDPTFWNTWVNASGIMEQGKGYAAEGRTGTTGVHNVSFTGTPNNGIIYTDVHHWPDSDVDNDFNLLGNPYPSAIDIELFFDANLSVIDPVVYLWTHNTPISNGDSGDYSTDDYATYNYTGGTSAGGGPVPDKNIGSSQGFFMRAINSGSVVFNNTMRLENANDQFFKSNSSKKDIDDKEEKDRIWLNLTTNYGGFNQLLIGFMDKASENVDRGYDALKNEANNLISFYSTIEENKYVIQGLPSFSDELVVNLGYDTKVAPRTFAISIDKLEGQLNNRDIYLFDNKLNITHNLTNSDYTFDVNEIGENPNRFILKFISSKTLSIPDLEELKGDALYVSSKDGALFFRANEQVDVLKIYDILGRKIMETTPNSEQFEIKTDQLKPGTILIIDALLNNNNSVSKKTIYH